MSAVTPAVQLGSTDAKIDIVRNYYAQAHDGAGKGKAGKQKQKALPTGIARNLDRGKPLPPGIAKRALPGDLSRRLPPVRQGFD